MADNEQKKLIKPVKLYDHLPGILAAYPAVLFLVLAALSLPIRQDGTLPDWWPQALNQHLLFWIGLAIMILWYIAYRFNLPKGKFFLAFGLIGTFVGIPVVLEITGYITPFQSMANVLGKLSPAVNAGAWFALSIVFGIIWLCNFVWSRTHLRVRIDESGLTLSRLGGKGERFDLIGLKTEHEPLDYLELFIAGIGSLSLKTRMNKPIFTMKRVVGLYRTPIFPFFRGKLSRIEEMFSFQGKVMSVDLRDRADVADELDGEDADGLGEDYDVDALPQDNGDVETPETPDVR